MIGEPPRHAAGRGDDVDVHVAVILPTEGDLGSVGRKDRVGFDAGAGSQSHGFSALARDDPEIPGENEHNVRTAQRGPLGEIKIVCRTSDESQQEEQKQDQATHRVPRSRPV